MRVLIASHSGGMRGGAEQCVAELARALEVDDRIDVAVSVPHAGELSSELRRHDIACHVIATPTWLVDESPPWPQDPWRGARNVKRLAGAVAAARGWRSLILRTAPDVVVSSTTASPTAALAARSARVPHVWWVHEFTTLDHRKRYCLGEPLGQRVIGALSRCVAFNSGAVARHYSPPIPPEKGRVVDLGVEPPAVQPNRIVGGRLNLLMLGRKSPAKGCDVAIRALAHLGDDLDRVTLRLVGPAVPGYSVELWSLAKDLGVLDRVEFVEYTTTPQSHVEWSNVLLMCSEAEAFGRVTIEALKSGRPVIGADSGATPDLVDSGVNGFVVRRGAPAELADVLRQLVANPDLVEKLSAGAQDCVAGRFTMTAEVEAFVEIFERVTRR